MIYLELPEWKPAQNNEQPTQNFVQCCDRLLQASKAADPVNQKIQETLGCYSFPDSHWRKVRTNIPLERLMKEIRRRSRVAGAFPDGQSCLCMAAVRLKHVAGTQWSTRKHMNMDPLREMKLQPNGAAVA